MATNNSLKDQPIDDYYFALYAARVSVRVRFFLLSLVFVNELNKRQRAHLLNVCRQCLPAIRVAHRTPSSQTTCVVRVPTIIRHIQFSAHAY